MTKDERRWGTIRFALLLLSTQAILFTLLCRYVLEVPAEESAALTDGINRAERIFQLQHACAEQARELSSHIDTLDFGTHQVQHMDEVKENIEGLQAIYPQHNRNTRFFFGVLLSRTLRFRFNLREELQRLRENNARIEQNLEECKANL